MEQKGSIFSFNKIPELESLRGFLAVWVVLSHLMIPYTFKFYGGYAVSLFMMISGYVISILITTSKESYLKYIIRRFLRLFPLFIVVFLFSVVIVDILIESIKVYPWQGKKEQVRLLVFEESKKNTFEHIITHLTMLHGAISEKFLPYSPYAFHGPAWSISLEWQFYILAPFIFSLYRSRVGFIFMLLVFFYVDEVFSMGAPFLPESIQFFIVGIATFCYLNVRSELVGRKWAAMKLVVLLSFLYAQCRHDLFQIIPFIVWLLVIKVTFFTKEGGFFYYLKLVLNARVSAYLGKISYSIYLIHMPFIFLCSYLCIYLDMGQSSLLYTLIYVPLLLIVTLTVSHFTYKYIEWPFVRLGRRI